MLFSKSFGYALRAILYVAATQQAGRTVQVEAVAEALDIPKFFLAKILKGLAKERFFHSQKGPRGGFTVPPEVLDRPIIDLLRATDGSEQLSLCLLRSHDCTPDQPCPLHHLFRDIQLDLRRVLEQTTLGALLDAAERPLLTDLTSPVSASLIAHLN